MLPLGLFALRHYQARLTSQTRTLRERSSDLGSFLIESLLGMPVVVASGAEEREADTFRRHNSNFINALLAMQISSFLAGEDPGTLMTLYATGDCLLLRWRAS